MRFDAIIPLGFNRSFELCALTNQKQITQNHTNPAKSLKKKYNVKMREDLREKIH